MKLSIIGLITTCIGAVGCVFGIIISIILKDWAHFILMSIWFCTMVVYIRLFILYIKMDKQISNNPIKIKDIYIYDLPKGSQIEKDFVNLPANELHKKYKKWMK